MANNNDVRVSFLSHPKTTAAERRSWLVRFPGTGLQPEIVRVYPSAATQFVCTCKHSGRGDCPHIHAARNSDAAKFSTQ